MDNASAIDWVARACRGDHEAWEMVVYRPHVGKINGHCYKLLADWDEADDVTSHTFERAYTKIGGLLHDPAPNIQAWLFRLATNACLDVLRRRQRIRMVPWEGLKHDQLLLAAPADDPERMAVHDEEAAITRRVMARMLKRDQRMLTAHHCDDLSCYEVGQELGMSRSAVKSGLFRARERFRREWTELEGGEIGVA